MRLELWKVEVALFIKEGLIQNCKIWGDFLALKDVSEIEQEMIGIKYDITEIRNKLQKFNLRLYFGTIPLEGILKCFIE